jgi:hypothetical protein
MLESRTNKQIIDDIFLRCSEKLDKQLYLIDNLLDERENLAAAEESLYLYVSGSVLQLNPDNTDTSNNPSLEREENKDIYEGERRILLRYLNTLIHFEITANHEEALGACVEMLKNSTRTFNQDFLNIVYLIVLFDGDTIYKYLRRPLATFCATVVDNEYGRESKLNMEESTMRR